MLHLRFFQIAIWLPLALILSLPLLESISRGTQAMQWKQILLIYGLSFGALAYPIFATWATYYIQQKTERTIIRLLWWAPFIFIPFYGVPWIIYGLINIAMGKTSGIGMALLWVSFTPYILALGYAFSAITFVIYKIFVQRSNLEN